MKVATISVTDSCPLNCSSCYSKKSQNSMTLQDFKGIIYKLPPTIEAITITGGEPFVLGDTLVEMCKYCAKNKVKPVIFSSGMFPDEEMIKKLAPHIKSIHTTVKYPDTMDAAWKGHKLAHENMKKLLETCHKLKVKTYIHFCVDQNNIKYFDEMKVFMKEHNATGMHILRFLAYHKDDISLTLSDDEWEEFCLHVVNNKDDLKIDIMYPSKQSYDICVAGATRINILTNGDVTGCIYIAKPIIGNIIVEDYPAIEKRLAKFREKYGKNTPCIARVECDFSFKK